MIRRRFLILSVLSFILRLTCLGNGPAILQSSYIDSIFYRISKSDIQIGKIVNFRFPPLQSCQPYFMESVLAKRFSDKSKQFPLYGCKFDLGNILFEKGKNSRLNIRLYARDIDTLFFSLKAKISQHVENLQIAFIKLQKDRFFFDFTFDLEALFKNIRSFNSDSVQSLISDSIIISGVSVFTRTSNHQKLIVGDLILYAPIEIKSYEADFKEQVINHLYLLVNNLNYKGISEKFIEKKLSLYEEAGVEFLTYPVQTTLKYFPDTTSEKGKVQWVSDAIKNILINYFENSENHNKKLLLTFDSLCNTSNCLDSFYMALEPLLMQLHDTHFKLVNNKKEQKINVVLPIHFYKILNEIQVVSILDTTLSKVTMGDQLLEVNSHSINQLIEDMANQVNGTNYHSREAKIIQKLVYELYDYLKDTLHLKLKNSFGEVYTLDFTGPQITKNKNIFIPPNIRAKQKVFDYKKVSDFGYLKVGLFQDYMLRPFLYSYIDSMMTTKGLVIDLRNNAAADFSLSFLLSFFINAPVSVFSNPLSRNTLETIMVSPDPFYYYSKPIVILFDSRTTCGSEYFINALLNTRKDVITISASRTSGSAQHANFLNLPGSEKFEGGLMYRSNILYNSSGNNTDEEGGIAPSIWTYFKSYDDLAPYNDKLLQYSVQYLTKLKESQARKQ